MGLLRTITPLFILILGVAIIFYYPTAIKDFNNVCYSKIKRILPKWAVEKLQSHETQKYSEKLFTEEELKKYDGNPDAEGIYLAILGQVFNVAEGARHYKPGGAYSFFAGKDATRAFITGEFKESDVPVDSVEGIDDESLLALDDWLKFYHEDYIYIGKLKGRYYDESGQPTEELKSVTERIAAAKASKLAAAEEKKRFPPCNSEWSREKGGRVWCTNKSGGVARDWVGVPRKFFKPGQKEPSCVCVRAEGPPSDNPKDTSSNVGDLNHPGLEAYPGCSTMAMACKLPS